MLGPDLVEQLLDRMPVARLAQLDGRAGPQALPFVFARVERNLWSPIDGKPKKTSRLSRLDWIRQFPGVCVLIDHYAADWSELWWLKLFCRCDVVHRDEPQWEQARSALSDKYPQYDTTPMFLGEPTMIRFQIQSWKSWAAGGDAAVDAWLTATAPAK